MKISRISNNNNSITSVSVRISFDDSLHNHPNNISNIEVADGEALAPAMMVIGARLEWDRPFKADLLAAYGPQSGPPAPGGGNPRPPPLVHSAQTIRSRADSREHFPRILLKIDHNRGKRL